MRNLHHLAAQLFNAPLMLQPATAELFAGVFESLLQGRVVSMPQALTAGQAEAEERRVLGFAGNVQAGARYESKPYLVTDAGVAVLGVYGALVQRAGQMDGNCMPLASYQRLGARLQAMQADPDVKAILLEMDSPGGAVAGNFELAKQMVATRGTKPVWTHANEGAYSAAYSLAAATDRIVVPQAGSVGSIGVVLMHMDQSVRDAKQGITYTPIYAGARKLDGSSHAPLSPQARATAQAEVDRMYDMFVTHVASARSLDAQAVRGTEAGVLAAHDAKALGLVDAVASFEDTLAELTDLVRQGARSANATSFSTGGRAAHSQKGGSMSTQATPAANTPAAPNEPSAQALAEARESGRTQGHTEGLAQGTAEGHKAGATAERTRVGGILRHEAAAGRTGLAMTLAFETDMTVDAAAVVLNAAAKDTAAQPTAAAAGASPLERAMATVPNPNPGPQGGNAEEGEESAATTAKNVVALFNKIQGVQA